MAAAKSDGRRVVAENRQARFEYFLTDDVEAGLMLTGTEVKALRKGQANITESYASTEEGGLWLINAYIPEYQGAGRFFQHEPRRKRRLLLHKKEIHKIAIAIERQGMTLIPLELYFNARGIAKLKLALDRLSFTSAEQAFRSTHADLFGFLIESKLAPNQIKAAFDSPGADATGDPKKPAEPLLEGKDALLILEVGTDCLATAGFTRVGAWLQRL